MPLEQQTIRTLRLRVYQNWSETCQKSIVFVVKLGLYEMTTSKKKIFRETFNDENQKLT
jgi:hypothetical protein